MAESEPVFTDLRFKHRVTSSISAFLTTIGLPTASALLTQNTFLPGLMISQGTLLIDESQLTYPGDLLHEAGHLALTPASTREQLHHNAGNDAGEEMGAIAWSYAAALYMRMDPAVVFHPSGYRGSSQAILENFAQGRYLGVPMLEWMGLSATKGEALRLQISPYPHMLKWLRD